MTEPTEFKVKPTEFEIKPTELIVKPAEFAVKPTKRIKIPIESGGFSTDKETKPLIV